MEPAAWRARALRGAHRRRARHSRHLHSFHCPVLQRLGDDDLQGVSAGRARRYAVPRRRPARPPAPPNSARTGANTSWCWPPLALPPGMSVSPLSPAWTALRDPARLAANIAAPGIPALPGARFQRRAAVATAGRLGLSVSESQAALPSHGHHPSTEAQEPDSACRMVASAERTRGGRCPPAGVRSKADPDFRNAVILRMRPCQCVRDGWSPHPGDTAAYRAGACAGSGTGSASRRPRCAGTAGRPPCAMQAVARGNKYFTHPVYKLC